MRYPYAAAFALLCPVAWGCGAVRAGPSRACAPEASPLTVLLIEADSGCAPGQEDIHAWVAAGTVRVEQKFCEFGWHDVVRVKPTERAVLEELARPRSKPLIVMYVGHVGLVEPTTFNADPLRPPRWVRECSERAGRCFSVACTRAPVTFDAMIRAVNAEVPWVLFLVDGCTSAHVDVREAKTRAAVMSVSPFAVDANEMLLSRAIADLSPNELDRDCDGRITDVELFIALNREFREGGERGAFLANPKFRRQTLEPLPMPIATRHSSCHVSALPSLVGTKKVDAHTYQTQDPVAADGGLTWDDQLIPVGALQITPCPDEVGQCFREWQPHYHDGALP